MRTVGAEGCATSWRSNSRRTRDLPTPASPTTVTRCELPSRTTRSYRLSSASSSWRRPTSGDSLAGATLRTECSAIRQTASQAGTGSAFPFSSSGSSVVYSTAASVERMVRSPTVTLPGRAALWSREATFTVSPTTV